MFGAIIGDIIGSVYVFFRASLVLDKLWFVEIALQVVKSCG